MAAFLRRHLERLRSFRLPTPGLVEFAGIVAVLVGVGMIYEPAAWIAGGLGAVLWVQGRQRQE